MREPIRFSTFNQSIKSRNVFEILYHSIKDLVKASEQDVLTINGKIRIFFD
jgi:hypothetical protein